MSSLERLIERACKALDAVSALALALMVVMVFGNVVLRYAFNSGITVSEELSRWLFIWMTFLGAAVAVRERAHLGTDLLVSRLGPRGRRVCFVAGLALMLWVNVLLFQGSLAQTRINAAVEAPVTGWSMALVYASGVVFATLSSAFVLLQLARALRGDLRDDELVAVRESEDLPAHSQDDARGPQP